MAELLEGRAAIAHLLRRAGFAPTPAIWNRLRDLEYDVVVEQLLASLDAPAPPDPEGFDPFDLGALQDLWLSHMLRSEMGLDEKLTLFWHSHFATSQAKVVDCQLMWTQYRLLRSRGAGNFGELVSAISRDVAMIRWLDGNSNRVGHANENYARELQELFTLGIGSYSEQDVREVARAFTGWGSQHQAFKFRPEFHDGGEKTIHGHTKAFDGEEVVALLVSLPACHRFIAGKLLRFFSHPDPTDAELDEAADAYRNVELNTRAFLRWLFLSPGFRDTSHLRSLVRSPVEFMIAGHRLLALSSIVKWIHGPIDRMGQILFNPPSVKGWPYGEAWLGSAAIVMRLRSAQMLVQGVPKGTLPERELLEEIVFAGPAPEVFEQATLALQGEAFATTLLGGPAFQVA